jgi:hypothetical protein
MENPGGFTARCRTGQSILRLSARPDRVRGAEEPSAPTIPSANTNAPSVMIGEFASRLLVAA